MAQYGRADSARRAALIVADTAQIEAFMSVVGETPVTHERIEAWSWSLPVMRFTPLVDSVFRDSVASVERAVGTALARLRAAGVELTPRSYGAVVWGRPESVMFVDSVMLIALNHYLGAESDAYEGFPLYLRLVKEPRLMPYDIVEAMVATDYPYQDGNPTALSRMLYEGALVAARLEGTEGGNPADAVAYRPEQMQFVEEEEANLWRTLVGRGYLFDTSVTTIDKLVAPAPNTSILDPRSPGRAGRWLGYRIVEKYRRKHPEVTLEQLLQPSFYTNPEVLGESGYNP